MSKTPLQKYLSKHKPEKLDMDSFGAIMDDFIREHECKMLITLPAGSTDVHIEDNMGAGPVMVFYFITNAIPKIAEEMFDLMKCSREDREKVTDAILKILRDSILDDDTPA